MMDYDDKATKRVPSTDKEEKVAISIDVSAKENEKHSI
jgi:hypothetical protein